MNNFALSSSNLRTHAVLSLCVFLAGVALYMHHVTFMHSLSLGWGCLVHAPCYSHSLSLGWGCLVHAPCYIHALSLTWLGLPCTCTMLHSCTLSHLAGVALYMHHVTFMHSLSLGWGCLVHAPCYIHALSLTAGGGDTALIDISELVTFAPLSLVREPSDDITAVAVAMEKKKPSAAASGELDDLEFWLSSSTASPTKPVVRKCV